MVNKPKVIKYVLNAIVELGDRNGSPLNNIIDLVRTNIAIDNIKPKPKNIALHTRRALQLAIEEGIVVEPTRGRYKIIMDEDNFVPRIRPTTCRAAQQVQQASSGTDVNNDSENKDNQEVEDKAESDDDNMYDSDDKERGDDDQDEEFCSTCGGRKRKRMQRARNARKQQRRHRTMDRKEVQGKSRQRPCRPPPIPKTPPTPPCPKQPCPPRPPSAPITPCDYFDDMDEDEDRDQDKDDNDNNNRNRRGSSRNRSRTPPPPRSNYFRQTPDAQPPDNENEVSLGKNVPNRLMVNDDGKDAALGSPPYLSNQMYYFGPGCFDDLPNDFTGITSKSQDTDSARKEN